MFTDLKICTLYLKNVFRMYKNICIVQTKCVLSFKNCFDMYLKNNKQVKNVFEKNKMGKGNMKKTIDNP